MLCQSLKIQRLKSCIEPSLGIYRHDLFPHCVWADNSQLLVFSGVRNQLTQKGVGNAQKYVMKNFAGLVTHKEHWVSLQGHFQIQNIHVQLLKKENQ